jgi:uncharacterized RDD family membrane protein YckC
MECGSPLRPQDLQGLCPKCLLKLGLASQFASTEVPASSAALLPDGIIAEPFNFGRYRIIRLLGKGGMGAVYEAEQTDTGRRVALKVLGQTLDTAEMRRRFMREGQLAAAVRHPNVVAVFSAEEVEGAPVIAMEMLADGTLKDRVKRKGPLPVGEAIDIALQMIDGLECAHAAGVLHRDIKPANCFLSHDGTVKVGDFGLSISTLAKAETQLTQSGTVLGTPAFASPEQLRGREIDVRSDIYGVGATLYWLLTGAATHDAESLVALIAAVLENDPQPPHLLRSDIPAALSRIIMRALARDRDNRFPSYDALRRALLPFSSAAPTPATLGLRFLAGLVDAAVVAIPLIICMLALGQRPLDLLIIERSWRVFVLFFAYTLFELSCYAVPEGLWGATLGKALCGLRVVRADNRQRPGLLRAAGRSLLFYATEWIAAVVAAMVFSGADYERRIASDVFLWPDLVTVLLFLGLFVTVRRKNGFAAVHDLLTGTRVIARPASVARPRMGATSRAHPATDDRRIGPFAVVSRDHGFIIARDELLDRDVFVVLAAPGTAEVATARRDLNRPGRLRWLNGQRDAENSWDAYEFPAGAPLTQRLDRKQTWAVVRFWLHDLAEEIAAAGADGTLPALVGTDRVWLTNDGRAILFEVPAPGATASRTYATSEPREVEAFLDEIAARALAPRVPLHAREFLNSLHDGRFDEVSIVAGNLRAALSQPAAISRRRRLFTIALPALFALGFALTTVAIIGQANREFDRFWNRSYPGKPSLRLALEEAVEFDVSAETRERLLVHIAGHHRNAVRNAAFWNDARALAVFTSAHRRVAEEAVAGHPEISASDLARADSRLASKFARAARRDAVMAWVELPFLTGLFLCAMLSIGALWTLVGRAPLALALAGGAIVTRDGQPATRIRAFARSIVAVAPALIGAFATIALQYEQFESALALAILIVLGGFLAAAILAVRSPERGLPDIIARTTVVPR